MAVSVGFQRSLCGRVRLPLQHLRFSPVSYASPTHLCTRCRVLFSFFWLGIIREPLDGKRAVCPIGNSLDSPDLDLEVWLASPVTTVQNLALARTIEASQFSSHTRVVCLPGFTVTIRGMLQALEIIKGPQILDLIEFKDDETNKRLVSSWPARFDCSYAIGLGFKADSGGMEKVIKDFIQMMEEQ